MAASKLRAPQGSRGSALVTGTVVGHFGVHGELKVAALDPSAFEAGRSIRLALGGRVTEAQIASVRQHRRQLLVLLRGVDSVEAARALGGARILVERDSLPQAGAGTFRAADLVGFEVRDARLGSLGTVKGVRRYPACDMLVVGERDQLIPMLRAYDCTVDRKRRHIAVRLPQGFEEL